MFLSILKGAAQFALGLFGFIKGSDHKPTLSELLPTILSQVLPAVQTAAEFQNLDTKEKVDAFLEDFDALTGVEATALDLIKDMPAHVEESTWDAVITIIRNVLYCRIGVEGYTNP